MLSLVRQRQTLHEPLVVCVAFPGSTAASPEEEGSQRKRRTCSIFTSVPPRPRAKSPTGCLLHNRQTSQRSTAAERQPRIITLYYVVRTHCLLPCASILVCTSAASMSRVPSLRACMPEAAPAAEMPSRATLCCHVCMLACRVGDALSEGCELGDQQAAAKVGRPGAIRASPRRMLDQGMYTRTYIHTYYVVGTEARWMDGAHGCL